MILPSYMRDVLDAVDEHDLVDRRDQAREAELEATEPCSCTHQVDDHWPGEGCVRRSCLCWWWAP